MTNAFHFLFLRTGSLLRTLALLLLFLSQLTRLEAQCSPDVTPPNCLAPADVTVSCEGFDETLAAYGSASGSDDCCLNGVSLFSTNLSSFDTVCNKGSIFRTFRALDCQGNSSLCTQHIQVNYVQDYYVRFPDDVLVTALSGTGYYGEPIFGEVQCELMGFSYSDQVFTNVPDAQIKIERTWTVINWCTFDIGLPLIAVPNPNPNSSPNHPSNLPGPTVSAIDAPNPLAPTITKINPGDALPTNYSIFYDADANGYRYTQIIKLVGSDSFSVVTGKVFADTLANCSFDAGEPVMGNQRVIAIGGVTNEIYEAVSGSDGSYTLLLFPGDTVAEVILTLPLNFSGNCPPSYTVHPTPDQTTVQNIAVGLSADCPILSVDLGAPFLRRCASNYYTVEACNLSAGPVEDVNVEVQLDEYFTVTSTSIPATALGSNLYNFSLGEMQVGECRVFNIIFDLSCSVPVGYTHCSSAHISPDTVCNWEGARISVNGYCDGDSVRLAILNQGPGDMIAPLDFVVTEDVIMYRSGSFQLDKNEQEDLAMPANGATWRLEAEQELNFPWGRKVYAMVEGCGGLNTPGIADDLPFETGSPFETRDCQPNVASFDPNDKHATPEGYGDEHFIEKNTDIEYRIRFQNTGTDTAFTVEVLDTLSALLDPTSIRPGVSSHPYDFSILNGNVLRFRFSHILLPDSNVNEAASHGFFQFRISQQPDLPNGSLIENSAAIYFDFNDPVITNTTFHTLGEHFVVVKTDDPADAGALRVWPNPAVDKVYLETTETGTDGRFELSDAFGKVQRSAQFTGNRYAFERQGLPAGMYFFSLQVGNGCLHTGKIILK